MNDQQDKMRAAIMNLPCPKQASWDALDDSASAPWLEGYVNGFRDARYAAAELVAAATSTQQARIEELERVLRLARDYVAGELHQRQQAYAGYPHKWSTEQQDLATVDAALSSIPSSGGVPAEGAQR